MKTYLLSIFLFLSSFLVAQLELSKYDEMDTIINQSAYSFSYNQKYHQANWVAYQLTRVETSKLFDRENKFVADHLISGNDLSLDYS